jgi:hypothetical protein
MMVLAIEELKPGMVLAEAVRNHQEHLLLEAGRKITEKSIRVFKSWGIRRVAVRLEPAGESEQAGLSASRTSVALDEGLRARFAGVLDDPIMVAILQAASRQLAGRPPRKKSRDGRS